MITIINPDGDYFSYIRVSSKRQDQRRDPNDLEAELLGSLAEQQRQNRNYAVRQDPPLKIYAEVVEVESASELNRPKFKYMIDEMERLKLKGIIFNKIDRSARNPVDQARLFTLSKAGYEFHFASESTSTLTHLGMSQVYIFWGLANVYTENLKFEVNKGISAALHEGRTPLPAPLGYLNMGEKQYKTPDPAKAHLVKEAFALYATGRYSLVELTKTMNDKGLRTKKGVPLHKNFLARMLREPFYYGHFRYRKQLHEGKHETIISKETYDKVQKILAESGYKKLKTFIYVFQNLLHCPKCGRKLRCLTGKKKHMYYACRYRDCIYGSLKEDQITKQFLKHLKQIQFTEEEGKKFIEGVKQFQGNLSATREEELKAITMEETRVKQQKESLTMRYVEGKIEEEIFQSVREKYMEQSAALADRRRALDSVDNKVIDQIIQLCKLLRNPYYAFQKASPEKRRRLVKSMLDKFAWNNGELQPEWKNEFKLVAFSKTQMVGRVGILFAPTKSRGATLSMLQIVACFPLRYLAPFDPVSFHQPIKIQR